MKKTVKKEKVVKKAPKLVKSVAPKAPKKHAPTVVDLKVGQTLDTKTGKISNDCIACKGIGLERPDWVGSAVCPRCKGTGKEN